MGSVLYNNNGTINRGTLHYNDNGVIKTEDDMEIYFNTGQEIIQMPQKKSMVMHLTPHYSFAYYTTKGANFMNTQDFVLKNLNSNWNFVGNVANTNKTAVRPSSTTALELNPYVGVWMMGKEWNKNNFNLPEPIFDGTNEATISMTFASISHNNDGFFWYLDNNTKWGIQANWTPTWVFRFRNNTNTGFFELPTTYGEAGVHNITVTFSGRNVKVYWNGNLVAQDSNINTDQSSCSRIWLNGYYNQSGTFCNLSMYSFRVWKVCLTDDEVATAVKFDKGYIS